MYVFFPTLITISLINMVPTGTKIRIPLYQITKSEYESLFCFLKIIPCYIQNSETNKFVNRNLTFPIPRIMEICFQSHSQYFMLHGPLEPAPVPVIDALCTHRLWHVDSRVTVAPLFSTATDGMRMRSWGKILAAFT